MFKFIFWAQLNLFYLCTVWIHYFYWIICRFGFMNHKSALYPPEAHFWTTPQLFSRPTMKNPIHYLEGRPQIKLCATPVSILRPCKSSLLFPFLMYVHGLALRLCYCVCCALLLSSITGDRAMGICIILHNPLPICGSAKADFLYQFQNP